MAERLHQTLRAKRSQLAQRRWPPRQSIFGRSMTKSPGQLALPFPEPPLRQILHHSRPDTGTKRLLEQFESAVNQKDWSAMQTVLVGYAKLGASTPAAHLDAAPATTGPAPLSPTIGSTVGARPGTVHKELAEQLRASLNIRSMA